MNRVFKPYIDRFIIIFIDDILIYSRSDEEHNHHLILTLDILRRNKLYGKMSKCEFYVSHIQYLGHIILASGISIDPKKIEAIMSWSTPTNMTKVRSFMGLEGYYRRLVQNFSKIANPITSL